MDVIKFSILIGFFYISLSVFAQKSFMTFDTTKIEIDFLSGYYDQDGENSPVTGGLGTEELSTIDNRIMVSFAPDSLHKITSSYSINVISSASTDKIDGISSASKRDAHLSSSVSYSRIIPSKRLISTWQGSLSSESDYSSKGISYGLQKASLNNNHKIGFNLKAFFDEWIMIFPEELRDNPMYFPENDTRNTYSLILKGNNIINKRTILYWNVGGTNQHGLLSTPFHRVYFSDTIASGFEYLPKQRFKFSATLGVNVFLSHFIILKPNYRLYTDDFGIQSNTFFLKTVVKLNRYISLKGALRFANQNGSKFFYEYAQSSKDYMYRTSDYDLSSFTSKYYNIGIRYSPLKSIVAIKRFSMDLLELRYTTFKRSTDFHSQMISLYANFSFEK